MMRTKGPGPAPARGRPRSESARRAILDAAFQLFTKGGYPATTVEAIAARSGVAKTTSYRWWPNRAALVVDLLLNLAAVQAPPPSGRNPIRALRKEFREVAKASGALPGQMLGSLLGEAQNDPEIREALVEGLFNPRREATARVIEQAQKEGKLHPAVPPLVAVDLLFGPIFYRRYIRQEPLNEAYVRQVYDHAMAGLGVPGTKTGRTRTRRSKR